MSIFQSNLSVPYLETVELVGYKYKMSGNSVKINGKATAVTVVSGRDDVLKMTASKMVNLSAGKAVTISWSHSAK